MNFSAVDFPAHRQQRKSPAMVGAGGGIFVESAAELGHDDRGDMIAMAIQVSIERRQPAGEAVDLPGLDSGGGSLEKVRVPAAQIKARDFQAEACLDDSCDLTQAGPEFVGGIFRAGPGRVGLAAKLLDSAEQIERLLSLLADDSHLGGIQL